jgi:hypothetical protein
LFGASIFARSADFLGFTVLVMFKKAKPRILLFGILDALGDLWTLSTLVL